MSFEGANLLLLAPLVLYEVKYCSKLVYGSSIMTIIAS